MRYSRRLVSRLLAALSWIALACSGDGLSSPTTGSLQITTVTTGAEPDPDGYTVQVDAGAFQVIESSSALRREGIVPGSHAVLLAGIEPNCVLAGENPRSVEIAVGQAAAVVFQVACSVTRGTIVVTTITTGARQDPDGYTLRLDGKEEQVIGLDASLELGAVSGAHSVALRDVAANCNIDGKNPRKVVVSSGRQSVADFIITCTVPVR